MTHLHRLTTLAVGTLVIALVAACGSSTSGSGSDVNTDTSAAVAALEKGPNAIPITEALPKKPEPGGTVVYFKTEVPQAEVQFKGLQAATDAVGWKVVAISTSSTDPASLAPAVRQAIDMKPRPVAVIITGLPYELWSQYVAELKAAGIIIIPNYVGEAPLSDTVPVNAAGPVNDEALAASLARWVTDDSSGKAHLLVQKVGAYQAITGWAAAMKKELDNICPDCKVSEVETSAAQIADAQAAQSIVSQIRKDPSIDYFVGYNGAWFQGLNQALKNAQLSVKVGGMLPLPQNVQDVMNGSGGAFLAVNNQYFAWFAVDIALRHAQGAPPVALDHQVFPAKLVTKASAKSSDADFAGPAGYEEQFLKLWKVR